MKKDFLTPKMISRIAIFIALSVVGAYIKFPSPTGTVAMDSSPGYFGALAFGYIPGAIIISLGHIATAFSTGFPLGTLHILVAVFMAIAGLLFRFGYKLAGKVTDNEVAKLTVACLLGAGFNSITGILEAPIIGWGMAIGLTPSLAVASFANAIVAGIAYGIVKRAEIL